MYFGDHFLPKKNNNLKIIKGDIRDRHTESSKNHAFYIWPAYIQCT